jgi:hypothetical protein
MAREKGPKFGGGKYRRGKAALPETHATDEVVEQLELFEEFRRDILPMLQNDLKSKLSSKELRQKYQSYITARILSIALGDPDSAKALTAAKDALDRVEGKAKETIEQNHRFSDMKDEQLDALLLSKLKGKSTDEDQAN